MTDDGKWKNDGDEQIKGSTFGSNSVGGANVQDIAVTVHQPPSAPPPAYENPAVHREIHIQESNYWSHGLFGCFMDIPNSILVCFCPFIVELMIAQRVGKMQFGIGLCIITLLVFALRQIAQILVSVLTVIAEEGNNTQAGRVWAGIQVIGLIIAVLLVIRFCFRFFLHKHIRKLFNIVESSTQSSTDLMDVAAIFCCYECVLCQEKKTVDELSANHSFEHTQLPNQMAR